MVDDVGVSTKVVVLFSAILKTHLDSKHKGNVHVKPTRPNTQEQRTKERVTKGKSAGEGRGRIGEDKKKHSVGKIGRRSCTVRDAKRKAANAMLEW